MPEFTAVNQQPAAPAAAAPAAPAAAPAAAAPADLAAESPPYSPASDLLEEVAAPLLPLMGPLTAIEFVERYLAYVSAAWLALAEMP